LSLIFLLALFDEIKEGNSGILFFVNTSNNLAVMYILILWHLREGSADLFILDLDLATLDSVVMNFEIVGQQKHFLLTQEADAKQI
jgi:hypothetical protein